MFATPGRRVAILSLLLALAGLAPIDAGTPPLGAQTPALPVVPRRVRGRPREAAVVPEGRPGPGGANPFSTQSRRPTALRPSTGTWR